MRTEKVINKSISHIYMPRHTMGSLSFVDNRASSSCLQRKAYTYEKPLVGNKIVGPAYHAHLGFDDFHTLKHPVHVYQPGENARQKNALQTNYVKDVGFGAASGMSIAALIGGPGELFTYYNGIEAAGGTNKKEISHSEEEDNFLVDAINGIGPDKTYSILGYNCQKWRKDVLENYDIRRRANGIVPNIYHIPKKIYREKPIEEDTPLLASYYGANENWDEKQHGLEFSE